jgi:hypothetical protein
MLALLGVRGRGGTDGRVGVLSWSFGYLCWLRAVFGYCELGNVRFGELVSGFAFGIGVLKGR